MVIFLSIICLCLCLIFTLVWLFHKLWWTPIRIQNLMASQGIKGPSYKFFHGNTKEISKMKKNSLSTPMDLSRHDDIFPRIQPHIYSWMKIYGKNYLHWHGPQPQLVITEPELIKEILNNKDGAYPKVIAHGPGKNLVGDGMVVSEGEKWSKMRKLANHAFHAESLKGMVPKMITSVETMLERWREHEEKEIDVYNEFRILTAEIISRTAFGSSYLEGKNIFEMLMKLIEVCSRNVYSIHFPGIEKVFKSSDDIEADKLGQGIRESIIDIVKKREENVKRGETESFGSDYLGSLISGHHDGDENKRISTDEIIDECKVFYIAGQETSNSLLAWIIFLLSTHMDWQEKTRNEVLELFGQENPNSEGIAKLKTMNLVINESARLYGSATVISRRVEREVKLGKNLILPADLEVLIPVIAIHNNPEIWGQDSHLFKPERFTEGVARATNNNIMAFIPFGFGPRTCVGMNFAMTEIKIALSMILQRYRFTLSPTYAHWPIHLITLRPRHGLQVVLHAL